MTTSNEKVEPKVYILLESYRFESPFTKTIHYLRSWRKENFHKNVYTLECFMLTHSTDSGLYYEEPYKDLAALAARKSKLLHRYGARKYP